MNLFLLYFLYYSYRRENHRRILFLVLFALFLITQAYISPLFMRSYNILILAPIVFFIIVYFNTIISSNRLRLISLLCIILSTFGFIRYVAMFPYFLEYGMKLKQAQAQFIEINKENSAKNDMIGVSSSLWVLSTDYNKIRVFHNPSGQENILPSIVFIQQEGNNKPAVFIGGCVLSHDYFIEKVPELFGIGLAKKMPGYAFATYDCKK